MNKNKEEIVNDIRSLRKDLQEFPYGSHVLESWAHSICEDLIRFQQELTR
jgi:hypothetical protein